MIPLSLHIAGFLSYHQPVELDFTGFELACISGQNGAGKSSLLDAVTWALFGQARKRDESVINLQSKAAEVSLVFEYEGNTYRVQRTLPRGKTTVLEFQVRDGESWRALTERTTRDTQARIEQALRFDYDTFINASFFLQGKADQFTQQNASRRKEVLGSILGLEVWEIYKTRTAARRRELEQAEVEIEGRLAEIDAELSEEALRKAKLKELEKLLQQLSAARSAQESALDTMRRLAATVREQRKLADTLAQNLERSQAALGNLEDRLAGKQEEYASYQELTARSQEIQAAYQDWQARREELARQDQIAASFRDYEEKRQPLRTEIETEKARLEQECSSLEAQAAEIEKEKESRAGLEEEIRLAREQFTAAETRVAERRSLEEQLTEARDRGAGLKAENERLKKEMNDLKERIEKLRVASGAACPLCGQSLTEEHRKTTLADLEREGKVKGDAHRANRAALDELQEGLNGFLSRIQALAPAEAERLAASGRVSQLSERMENLQARAAEWSKAGAKRLKELSKTLHGGTYAVEARKKLKVLDRELAKLGYDAAAHDQARLAEAEARPAEDQYRRLESAQEVSRRMEGEIETLLADIQGRKQEIEGQRQQYNATAEALAAAEAAAPNPEQAEDELLRLREQENQVRDEAGAARQKVDILDTLRARRADHSARREDLNRSIAQHKTLERAFGRDGVPALLIEQALPQIESRANELLDRLSDGQMSIRFVTQAEYKDKKRGDLRETLDIQISDGAGLRDYEMYSGGEAFRVNFAIRLALSEVLAQRKGARLQTLVIDEGFGSQDVRGRQRLIEAINLVKPDFAKILVITHLDELKDAFPTRIEVEKTGDGSMVRVI